MRIMRSSNPVFSSLEKNVANPYARNDQFGQGLGFDAQPTMAPRGATQERAITIDDIVTKTAMTLGVIIAVAIVTFFIGINSMASVMPLFFIGAIGAVITVMVGTGRGRFGSKGVTLTYAVFEGLVVGGVTFVFAGMNTKVSASSLVFQAVVGTLGVFIGMLIVYKNGAIRVSPRFTRVLTGCLVGVMVMVVANLIMALFGFNMLYGGGAISIIFSLFCIGLAAMCFLQDFDTADKLIRAGAPASAAWGVALGLAVTLVWLYTEILRLLSYFNQR